MGGIRTLLIANRGEIALRIMRTARRMSIRVVAVYSDADASALHVAEADMAVRIGLPPPRESYLNIPAILAAARQAGADAIHPGYGFLAENTEFAEACEKAGFIFVGPPAKAIAMMGDKGRARALVAAAGVPVVPGYEGGDQSPDRLAVEAGKIGFPVMLKAAAGGGGKGMRVVAGLTDFPAALEGAGREAQAAFGDPRMIVEKYLTSPRHIEVQVFADGRGNIIHLFERDCSIQRRHQKVIEEAPAPGLTTALREKLRSAAIASAKSCGYVGAGTVEFLVAEGHFYFMEMNTRLQVEHTVTEAVTGLDLVEWQLRVASGERLPLAQDDIRLSGHAIEARLCAEDPENGFLPQSGRLEYLRLPEDIRVDAGFASGDDIPVNYDSLIAKLVAYGATRDEAVDRLSLALAETEVAGVANNRRLLADIVASPAFRAGDVDTGFITQHASTLVGRRTEPDETDLALATLAIQRRAETAAALPDPRDPHSPWMATNSWRLGGHGTLTMELETHGKIFRIGVQFTEDGYEFGIAGKTIKASGKFGEGHGLAAVIGDRRFKARAVFDGPKLTLFTEGREFNFTAVDPYRSGAGQAAGAGHLASPMPGVVVAVTAKTGQQVAKGQALVVIEAMKMEHVIAAPHDGRVTALKVKRGDRVAAGEEVAELEAGP